MGEGTTIKVGEVELAYLAGFFDGEGTILLTRRSALRVAHRGARIYLCIKVANTNHDSLLRFQRVFGGNIYKMPKGKGVRLPAWDWSTVGGMAEKALSLLRPYLAVKARQADLAISFRKLQIALNETRLHRGGHEKYTEDELNQLYHIREVLYATRNGKGRKY